MFLNKDRKNINFAPVALFFILVGIAIFTYGIVAWIFNVYNAETLVAFPSVKIIGGAVIIVLSYIQLEIEDIRQNKK